MGQRPEFNKWVAWNVCFEISTDSRAHRMVIVARSADEAMSHVREVYTNGHVSFEHVERAGLVYKLQEPSAADYDSEALKEIRRLREHIGIGEGQSLDDFKLRGKSPAQ